MAKQKKPAEKTTKTGRFLVGESFQKISLVEGIRLTSDMKKRAADAVRSGASPEEYRKNIVRSHRKA